ncbi:MAG: DUF1080 domain-containing protein [Limisphaerales bacterium]
MNPVSIQLLLSLALLAPPLPILAADPPAPSTLSDQEKADGWRLLFDGTTTRGWRSFKKDSFPAQGWTVRDGCLGHVGQAGGGDIVTVDTFQNYEFVFEWRINAGGNSGVKYFIDEKRNGAIGHEYQLLGPRNEAEARKDLKHATASFYDVLPVGTTTLPRNPGLWNQSRIVIRGQDVEHWLNGERVLAYTLGSEPVVAGIAASKFKRVDGFGTSFPHPILLQDHGGEIWFRNLKIRPSKP